MAAHQAPPSLGFSRQEHEWVDISFSNAWKWKMKVKSLSRVWLFATPWTAAYQAPPSMGFSRQEYWHGVPLPSPVVWLADNNYRRIFGWISEYMKQCSFSPFSLPSLVILCKLWTFWSAGHRKAAVGGEWEWLLTLMFFLQLHRDLTTVWKDNLCICFAVFLEALVVIKGEWCFNGRGADI